MFRRRLREVWSINLTILLGILVGLNIHKLPGGDLISSIYGIYLGIAVCAMIYFTLSLAGFSLSKRFSQMSFDLGILPLAFVGGFFWWIALPIYWKNSWDDHKREKAYQKKQREQSERNNW